MDAGAGEFIDIVAHGCRRQEDIDDIDEIKGSVGNLFKSGAELIIKFVRKIMIRSKSTYPEAVEHCKGEWRDREKALAVVEWGQFLQPCRKVRHHGGPE